MNKILVSIIVLVLIAVGAVVVLPRSNTLPNDLGYDTEKLNVYTSEKFGFQFYYPKKYFLEEKEVGNAERYHYAIILTEDTEENRLVREGKSPGREGPVSINIDTYQNNLDNLSAEEWIRNTNDSNFKLSLEGVITKIMVGNKEALSYRWSGLYEADNLVVARDENIFSFVVTYLTPEDEIRKDFDEIIKAVEFE